MKKKIHFDVISQFKKIFTKEKNKLTCGVNKKKIFNEFKKRRR